MSHLKFDVRNFTTEQRETLAWKIRNAEDFNLPNMRYWNYDPCRKHRNGWDEEKYDPEKDLVYTVKVKGRPNPKCNDCGIELMQHQRLAVAWMYMKKKGLLADTPGVGKMAPLSEPVLTPSGWSKMGDLEAGDYVIGSNGKPTEVLNVYPQEDDTVYRVTFNDGSSTRCGPDHLWTVIPKYNKSGREYVVTTREMLEGHTRTIQWESNGRTLTREVDLGYKTKEARPSNKWYIPMVKAVEFEPVTLECDPYFLGTYLGDGFGRNLTLNGDDLADFLNEFDSREVSYAKPVQDSRGTNAFRVGVRGNKLPKELEGKRSWEKFVPHDYLHASPEDRLALLQGLLDTDGSAIATGGVEYSTTSPELRDGVVFLAQSLGGVARVGKARKSKYTHDGEVRTGRESYRVNVKLPSEFEPFKVSRKLNSWVKPTKYNVRRLITDITLETPEQSVCIRVAAEDSLYVTKDFIVTHNTFAAIGLLAMLYETGEVPNGGKAIFVPRAPALYQWYKQMVRAIPYLQQRLLLIDSKYSAAKRKELYLSDWDVLLMGPEMYRNDYKTIEKLGKLELLVTDDVDQLRNPETSTSYALDRLGRNADRYFIMTGSPLQKRLPELHAVLDGVGGDLVLGRREDFVSRHVRYATSSVTDQYGREQKESKIAGYTGLAKVKQRIAPLVLRRTAEDITDARFPDIVVDDIFLDLYRPQRAKYLELQNDVLRILKEDGTEQQKRIQAIAKLHYGSSICAGLSTLGEADGPNTSVKFDWVVNTVAEGGSLADEKVVIFANLRNSVRTLQKRFNNVGVKYVTVWGEETSKEARMNAQEQFWNDPDTRVLIGTRAIEQSLNLQVARHLINVDMILNPERMTQLAGRVRRFGSEYSRVFVHNLLTNNTHEERFLPLLEREAALSSFIWEEKNHLFKELSPVQMMQMITG